MIVWSESYETPGAWHAFDPATQTTTRTALRRGGVAAPPDLVTMREFAVSKDGTRVPVNIVMKRGTQRDGSNPVYLTGYGGYGLSRKPRYSSVRMIWLEQGGLFVEANLRGGSEFGKEWHEAGRLTHKQNVFDDFAAVAEHLVEQRYTSRDRLALIGGSNGGLLMGAMLTQHPQLARAVVSLHGLYDMLRSELTPNGEFNIPEFGTVKDAEQYRALRAYSPYHQVVEGQPHPAVLFLSGRNDPRVSPWQTRKMVARLQEATDYAARMQAVAPGSLPEHPILLRASGDTGHGYGTPRDKQIAELADQYAFLFWALGVPYDASLSGGPAPH